jgi:ABC-type lipoprotein export system ATPase subunit
MQMLRELHDRTAAALLVVTHDPSVASYCDRHIEIVDGRITRDHVQTPGHGRLAAPSFA